MKYKKIGIIADNSRPETHLIAEELAQILSKAAECRVVTTSNENLDLLIVLGGDGFLLHTIHSFFENIPLIYGINYGSVGFLMNDRNRYENIINHIESAE